MVFGIQEMKNDIENFLDKCPFYNYNDEKAVHNYVGSFLWQLNQNAEFILRNSMNQKAMQDFTQVSKNNDLQNIALYYEEILKILSYIENKYIVKKKLSHYISILHKVFQKSVLKLSSVISLYCSYNYDDFFGIYRCIYEHFIIFLFVYKNEDISDAFIDHSFMTYYMLVKEFRPNTEDELEKIKEYEVKYGEVFKDEYGWAQSKINKKGKIILKDLIDFCDKKNIENMAYNYVYSCKFVHATAYSIYVSDNTNLSPFIRSIIEMISYEFNSFIDCIKTTNKEKILLKKLVLELSNISTACIKHYEQKA